MYTFSHFANFSKEEKELAKDEMTKKIEELQKEADKSHPAIIIEAIEEYMEELNVKRNFLTKKQIKLG